MTAMDARERRNVYRPSLQAVLLLVSVSFVLLINAIWLAMNQRPPRWDESENLILAEIAYQRLIALDWAHLFSSDGTARPNFIPLLTALSYFVVGRDYDLTVFLQNSLSLVITSLCLYDL